MKFDFPQRPSGSVEELWRSTLDLLPQIESRVLTDRAIGTVETPVAHGLGFAPKAAVVIPRVDCRWWRTRTPDSKYVYLAANTAITADVMIIA